MYIPPHFIEHDTAEIAAILAEAPLACLVAQTPQGLVANHIPLLATPDGRLIGHAALANDLHRLIPDGHDVLAVFRGADAYISPNTYPSKADHHRHVPTWNYQAVHIHGTISFQHDTHSKRAAVALLTRLHERRQNGPAAWKMADAPADYIDTMLAAIVAFRIDVTGVLAKSKLGQNRTPRDLQGAVDELAAQGKTSIAAKMARALPTPD